MKIEEEIQMHINQISAHKESLKRLGHLEVRFKLPPQIPFVMSSNYLRECHVCKRRSHTFVAYHSQLICSKCARKKWGDMTTVINWEVLR